MLIFLKWMQYRHRHLKRNVSMSREFSLGNKLLRLPL